MEKLYSRGIAIEQLARAKEDPGDLAVECMNGINSPRMMPPSSGEIQDERVSLGVMARYAGRICDIPDLTEDIKDLIDKDTDLKARLEVSPEVLERALPDGRRYGIDFINSLREQLFLHDGSGLRKVINAFDTQAKDYHWVSPGAIGFLWAIRAFQILEERGRVSYDGCSVKLK